MKRLFSTFILALSCLVAQAEQSYTLSSELPGGKDHHYIANSHILLTNGFKSIPSEGHEVILEIDKYAVFPPMAGITGGSSPNSDGVVGTLNGIVDVSLLGGALYAIPIDLPEGLGGLKPELSICYNNQAKNGLLGWGWDLTGLSSITRTGGTLYYDDYISAVNYTQDRFCLDGMRLLMVDGSNYGSNGASYRTEQDVMSNIVSYHESDIDGPSFFKVCSADGKILYYGNSPDSKALMDQQHHVNSWLINKVSDRYGNTMEYHYLNEKDRYRLEMITYSGNSNDNIPAAFTVEFHYSERSDSEVCFMGNTLQKKNDLLESITVKNGGSTMYSYQFTYKKPSPQEGYPYHLLEKVLFTAGDEHYNPTKIVWAGNNYPIQNGTDVKMNVVTNGITDAFLNAVKFSGDFNGDGHTDVIRLKPNGMGVYNTAELLLNKGVSGSNTIAFDHVKTFQISTNITWVYVADFNGDGLDDLLFSYRARNSFPFPDYIDTDIYLSRITLAGQLDFTKYIVPLCYVPHDMEETHLVGDFLGEGKDIFLVQSSENSNGSQEATLVFYYDEATDRFHQTTFLDRLDANRFFTADYNGDGITEILYKKDESTHIAQLCASNGTFHYEETYCQQPVPWSDCFPGDYNGDGLIDVLFYVPNTTKPWTIFLSDKAGLSTTSYPLRSFPYSSPGNYHFALDCPNHTSQFIKVGDFDGNGCSDLALFKDQTFHVFYGPIRDEGNDTPFSIHQQISIQLFNLYDNMTLCLGNFLGKDNLSFLGSTTLSHLPSLTCRHEVKSITDGMGNKKEFEYEYLMPKPNNPTENDFYRFTSICSDHSRHVYCTYLPLRALKKLTTYNVSDKPVETRCFYEGALVHKRGKEFLGFSRTRQENSCNNQLQKKVTRQFELEPVDEVINLMMEEENVFDSEGCLLAKSTYSNSTYTHLRNRRVFIPINDKKTIEEYDVDHPERLIKKEIQSITVNTNCTSPYHYNDVVSVTNTTKGTTELPGISNATFCEFQEIQTTEYVAHDLNSWLINRPLRQTHIFHREGNYSDIYRQKTYSYNSGKPYQVKSVLDLPNDGSNPDDPLCVLTEYQYDPVGNVKRQTISAPNDRATPRMERFEYSKAYGRRLLTKHTNALGQETAYSYEPIYNYCISVTDCNGLVTRNEQDPLGITKTTTYPDGTSSVKATRWLNQAVCLWEKKTGQQTKITHYAVEGEPLRTTSYDINGEPLHSEVHYDAFGRISEKTLPHKENRDAQSVIYNYDKHGRVERILHHDGTFETIESNGAERSTCFHALDGSVQSSAKTSNVMGWTIKSTDAHGESVIYDYYPDGSLAWSQIEGHPETRISLAYDARGNRVSLNDPNYGTTTYEYNIFNELTSQMTPKNDQTRYFYNELGNTVKRIETSSKGAQTATTEWLYGKDKGQNGLLTTILSDNQTIEYQYDDKLRLTAITEDRLGTVFKTSYHYNDASMVSSTVYPSGFIVNHCYNSEGQLKSIFNEDGELLWKASETNALGFVSKCVTGNGFVSEYHYDPRNNRLLSLHTTHDEKVIQDYVYEYDDYGNMTRRKDLRLGVFEQFTYDDLNRLTGAADGNGSSQFVYDALGRMTDKTGPEGPVFSNANYSGPKPHAIKSAQTQSDIFPSERMDLSYTSFDKVSTISEGSNQFSFLYGYDHQRIRVDENSNGTLRNKMYVNNCEFVNGPGNSQAVWTFLTSPMGVFAVAETIDGKTTLHYIHKDHLGSWTTISNQEGDIEQENSFDCWGNSQNPNDLMFDRGYTGHEHLRGTGLVNMNGRLYDPLTSSMLSPDNNIQLPDYTQSLNRYAYCINNPLSYNDPDGNTFLESALMFYLLYCTDFGYEIQKYSFCCAFHLDLHLSSQLIGIGADFSFGVPKQYGISYRAHLGATYYWRFYDNSYTGWEFRVGGEWCVGSCLGYSGTRFFQHGQEQVTNSIILGNWMVEVSYENDYMFNLAKYLIGIPEADNGDRYRTAAARIRVGPVSIGANIYTGDPGLHSEDRKTFADPEANGRLTYTINDNGDDPDQYRACLVYAGIGPIKIGVNSETMRNLLQNRFAHDFLCQGDSPYFKVLDRPNQTYFYFGTGTGGSLW